LVANWYLRHNEREKEEKMRRHIYKNDCFISVTTRRANHTNTHFGKFTFWKSKNSYDTGDTRDAITYSKVYLGTCEHYLEIEINKFIDKIKSQEGKNGKKHV
jgi:hypothetical protein